MCEFVQEGTHYYLCVWLQSTYAHTYVRICMYVFGACSTYYSVLCLHCSVYCIFGFCYICMCYYVSVYSGNFELVDHKYRCIHFLPGVGCTRISQPVTESPLRGVEFSFFTVSWNCGYSRPGWCIFRAKNMSSCE